MLWPLAPVVGGEVVLPGKVEIHVLREECNVSSYLADIYFHIKGWYISPSKKALS